MVFHRKTKDTTAIHKNMKTAIMLLGSLALLAGCSTVKTELPKAEKLKTELSKAEEQKMLGQFEEQGLKTLRSQPRRHKEYVSPE